MGNGSKHCCNLNDITFTIFVNHCADKYDEKKSLLVIYKIRRLFVNTLTADDKHYRLNRENLTEGNQMELSQKQKTFSEFFFCIIKIYVKFHTLSNKK